MVSPSIAYRGDKFKSCDPTAKKEGCNGRFSCRPPFFVTDTFGQEDLIYENFRSLGNEYNRTRYIPKGSIVHTPPEIYNKSAKNNYRVPIEVLSVPNSDIAKTLADSRYWGKINDDDPDEVAGWHPKSQLRDLVKGHEKVKKVELREQGYLDKRSLKPAGEYTFFVTKDSPVYRTPGGKLKTLVGDKLKLKMAVNSKGVKQYLVNRCCSKKNPEDTELTCHNFYMFEAFDKNNKSKGLILNHNLECTVMPHLRAIASEEEGTFQSIANILKESAYIPGIPGIQELALIPELTNDTVSKIPKTAFIKLPMNELGEGPFNSYHYNADDKNNSDTLLKPVAACTFMQILKEFDKQCSGPGCEVMFGDLYHENDWDNHNSHGDGTCVDIRYFRKNDDKRKNGGFVYTDARYDRVKTLKFVDILIKAGAEKIYSGDNTLLDSYSNEKLKSLLPIGENPPTKNAETRPKSWPGHKNHLHFCLPLESQKIQKTCNKGIPKLLDL